MVVRMIGCGGIGSFLLPALIRLNDPLMVIVMDGDKFEEKNLDRQLFCHEYIGKNKAEAMATEYGVMGDTRYYEQGMLQHEHGDVLMLCVDNHRARAVALAEAEAHGLTVIIGGNETHSASAYVYIGQRRWKGTDRDPLKRYPEIATDRTGDPVAAGIGCIEEANTGNVQLVSANMMAAALMAHLFTLWVGRQHKLPWNEMLSFLPYEVGSTLSGMSVLKPELAVKAA